MDKSVRVFNSASRVLLENIPTGKKVLFFKQRKRKAKRGRQRDKEKRERERCREIVR